MLIFAFLNTFVSILYLSLFFATYVLLFTIFYKPLLLITNFS
jgi:hypothetical protein